MEAKDLPSKIQVNLLIQKITVQWNLKSTLENLPDDIIPYHIHVFSKNIRTYYKISEDQFILQYKIHFTEVNSLTVGMTDSRVSPWWIAFLQTLPPVLLVQLWDFLAVLKSS